MDGHGHQKTEIKNNGAKVGSCDVRKPEAQGCNERATGIIVNIC